MTNLDERVVLETVDVGVVVGRRAIVELVEVDDVVVRELGDELANEMGAAKKDQSLHNQIRSRRLHETSASSDEDVTRGEVVVGHLCNR